MDFSHDGKHIVSASWDKTAKLWDILTAECLLNLTGHKDKIEEALFSRDEDHIVTCSDDGTAIVWCACTGQTLQVLQHGDQVPSAAISPDGRYVITASSKFVKIWETETGNLLFKIAGYPEDNPKPTAAFSPDGKSFIIGSGKQTTKMWILPPEDLLKPHTLKLTIFANFIREYLNSLGEDPASYQGFISFLTKKCGDNAKSYEKIIFDNLHTDMRTYLRALIKGRPD
jgi:WD40 repeat protein